MTDPITPESNPREALQEAIRLLSHPYTEATAVFAARASAWAAIAQAQAMLQPDLEDVAEAAVDDALGAMKHIGDVLVEVRDVLQEAVRKGPRHPALSRALKIADDGLRGRPWRSEPEEEAQPR
jgi:hypothetical protein